MCNQKSNTNIYKTKKKKNPRQIDSKQKVPHTIIHAKQIQHVTQKCLTNNNHKIHNSVPYTLVMPTESERVSGEKGESVRRRYE